MFERLQFKAAMRKDGFSADEINTAMRILATTGLNDFEAYCREVVANKAQKATSAPDWSSIDAYLI